MSRPAQLTVIKGGIDRLRTKGGARADTLYDLVNGQESEKGTVRSRPGTRRNATLPSNTRGLVGFRGEFHTFSHVTVALPSGYVLHVLTHPTDPAQTLTKIHFAKPFLGFLYVVAEFADGNVSHYWMRTGGPWQANKIYRLGDVVEPTTPNGIAYQATRLGSANPSWAPNVPRTIGDIVEPVEYNDYYYTVVDTLGANPRSGTVEPVWPESPGAQIVEDTEGNGETAPTSTPDPAQSPGSEITDRYGTGL